MKLRLVPNVREISYGHGTVGEDFEAKVADDLPKEGYRLILDADGTKIEYSDEAGLFYARKTLSQIVAQCKDLPCVTIVDYPKYRHRGVLIDCCRHFFTVSELKRQINVMAELKLNRFHWHLTDDQGWRAEIKKYPLLTEIGSVRSGTKGDEIPVGGYYTQEEMRELVDYCAERHIEIIPEVDLPGHFTAALAAYPHLGCTGEKMEVAESFGIFPNIACAGKRETAEFLKDVLSEICEIFPSKYVHIGGDEANKLRYFDCPDCQKRMKDENIPDEDDLQGVLMREITEFLNEKGRVAVVWNDGLSTYLEGDYAVQYWTPFGGNDKKTERAAAEGKEIILSPNMHFYFDYPERLTPLRKAYKYPTKSCGLVGDPEKNPTKSCGLVEGPGKNPTKSCGLVGDPEIIADSGGICKNDNVLGLEGTLWAEYIDTVEKLERYLYPRIFAVADRAWAEKENFADFNERCKVFSTFLKSRVQVNISSSANPYFLGGVGELLGFLRNLSHKSIRDRMRELRREKKIKREKKNKRKNL